MCAGSAPSSATSSRALAGRQAGGRLVEQDQARRAGERHADLELALLAVRQRGHRLVGDVGEAHALEQLVGGRDGFATRRRKLKRPRARRAPPGRGCRAP